MATNRDHRWTRHRTSFITYLFITFILNSALASPSPSSPSSSSSSSSGTFTKKANSLSQNDQPFTSILYTAVDGGKVALPCNIIPPTVDDHVVLILWYKDDEFEPIYTIDARKEPLENAQVISSSSLADRVYFNQHNVPAFLQLDPVQVRDAGEYRCRVDFKKARTVNTVIQLKVIVPPEEPIISYRYPAISQKTLKGLIGPFNEGDTLALLCTTFGGKPRPTLTWWKDYSIIDDTFEYKSKDVTVNELVINSLARHHLLSIFTCQAINNNITIASSASITIDLNLKPLEVKIKQLTPILLVGEEAKFECTTFGSKPKAKIHWIFDGTRYDTTFQGDMQTISIISLPLKRSHNNRILSCFVENPRIANSSLSDNLVLNAEFKPEVSLQLGTTTLSLDTIQEGNDIYFECVVDGNPLPDSSSLQWRFNDQILEPRQGIIQSNYSLVLQRINRSMSGKYQCEASNRHGKSLSNAIQLNVRFAPYCKFSSTLAYGLSLQETANLHCEVDSNPAPLAFYWKFERDSDLVSNRLNNFSSVIHFRPNSTQHYGTIECTAKNEIGIQQVPCKYHIIDSGPPIFPFYCGLHNQSITRVTIKCTKEQLFTNDVREQHRKSSTLSSSSSSSSSFSSSSSSDGGPSSVLSSQASSRNSASAAHKTQTIFVHPTTFYIAEVYDRNGNLEQNITLHPPGPQSLKASGEEHSLASSSASLGTSINTGMETSEMQPFLANVSSFNFQVDNLLESTPYKIRIYARNARGKSGQLWINAQTLRKAEKYTLSNNTSSLNIPTVSGFGDTLSSLGQIKSLAIGAAISLIVLILGILIVISFMGRIRVMHASVKRSQLKNDDAPIGNGLDNETNNSINGIGGCLHDLTLSGTQDFRTAAACITTTGAAQAEYALHSLGLQTLYTETNDAICSEYYRNLLTHYGAKPTDTLRPEEMQMLSLDLYKINSAGTSITTDSTLPASALGGPPDLIPTFYYNNDPGTAGTSSSGGGTITLDSDATMTILDTSQM